MRNVSLLIRSSEWEEEAEVPFAVKEIKKIKNYTYPFKLKNKAGEEEVYPIEDTLLLHFIGETDEMAIAVSNSLIYIWNEEELDKAEKLIFDLKPQKRMFEIGMSIGLYFDVEMLPSEIKGFEIKMEGQDE